jgi:hypothetical protein
MAYELTCPSCQARLLLKDDTGEKYLLCPRCLNMVPRPSSVSQATVPAAAASAIAALPSRSTRSVPTVESETGRSMWSTYFIILTVTVLAVLGVVLTYLAAARSHPRGGGNPAGGEILSVLIPLAFLCDAALTVLILFPVGYAMVRGTRPAPGTPRSATVLKRIVVIVLLVILGPIAACIVFYAVCAASFVVVNS